MAQLQSELAQSQLDAVLTQINSPSTAPGATPLTPREEQQARIEERRRAEDALDASFELIKAELGLLRATGEIEKWCEAAFSLTPNSLSVLHASGEHARNRRIMC